MKDNLNLVLAGKNSSRWTVFLLLLSSLLTAPLVAAQAEMSSGDTPAPPPTFLTIDIPGAGDAAYQGTFALAMNMRREIVGDYEDANGLSHGFVRKCDGTIEVFAPVGAVNGTYPSAINDEGTVTGSYVDINFNNQGFIRTRDGVIYSLEVPAGINGTTPLAINDFGSVTGNYFDLNFGVHGFVRRFDGKLTTFDEPDAFANNFLGTLEFGSSFYGGTLAGINWDGAITGSYSDVNSMQHGFLRTPDGNYVTLDVPGGSQTGPTAISFDRSIIGSYFQPIAGNPFGGNYRGFLRSRNNDYATFDAATYAPCCIWTFPEAINPQGAITGYDNDGHNLFHAFVRSPDGTITIFDAPGAGTQSLQGTLALGIDLEGSIVGWYADANNVRHGFMRTVARRH